MSVEMMGAGAEPAQGEGIVLPPLAVPAHLEMNHRIANSLQLVTAMLATQHRDVAHPEAREALGMAISRVTAIASVHRHLYRSAQASRLGLADYLADLVENLRAGCAWGSGQGRIGLQAEQLLVPTDFASTIGVLVTELVINACKHAYGPGETGDIDVRLIRIGSNEFALEVRDYGTRGRMPRRPRPEGVGSRIIDSLSRRLGLQHSYVRVAKGTCFVLSGAIPSITG